RGAMFRPFALDINWTIGQDYGQWLSEKLRNNFRANSREVLFSELAWNPQKPHSVYNDVGSVKTHFSAHLPGSAFSLTRNLFLRPRFVARIVRWNRLRSTSHLFDPNPRQDHDSLFRLPNALGRQDAHSISRS